MEDGNNVTDMDLDELSENGYVDESTIDEDGDYDYSDAGWDNFTDEDHDRVDDAIEYIADLNSDD